MLRIYYGETGAGKSKRIITECNNRIAHANGTVVYIDDDKAHSREINYKIRFVDASDYQIENANEFYGFLCGIAAQDHDLEAIYADGFMRLVQTDLNLLGDFFSKIQQLVESLNIDVYISVTGEEGQLPSFLVPYAIDCNTTNGNV